jgi:large subunit ribosomal protein L21
MQYAVIETGGKQYKITNGDVLEVDRLNVKAGESIALDKVLLTVNDGSVEIGAPYLEGVTVSAKVVDNFRGEKIRAARFRAKSNYHRVTGFRAELTRLEISDIQVGSKKQKESKKTTKV